MSERVALFFLFNLPFDLGGKKEWDRTKRDVKKTVRHAGNLRGREIG